MRSPKKTKKLVDKSTSMVYNAYYLLRNQQAREEKSMEERFETFTLLITKINRNIKKIKNHEMAEYGLRSAHVSCLYYLYSSEALTATELTEKCDEDKATVSRALSYLEANGFITCDAKHAKRYKSPMILTEKGRSVGKKIADKINSALTEMDTVLTEDERTGFYRSLLLVSEGLDAIGSRFDQT